MSQTTNNPDIPHISAINDGLCPGKMLRIQGTTPPTSQRFNINLQCGPNVSPRDDIALHLAVKATEGYIARNSLNGQTWGEEQGQGYNPIAPGQPFEILILTDQRDYKIAINGKHFCEFVHRIPFNRVSHITIDGDVSIKLINFELSAPPPNVPMGDAPPQGAGPVPPQGGPYGGPPMYGPPGQPPMGGAYGQQPPYGGPGPYGPYGPPPPPGHNPDAEKGSGLEGFLGQAGAAIAGAFGNAVLQGAMSGKQGPAQQAAPQAPPPQQPLAGGYGGQSVGGLGSIGSFLTNALSESILKPKQKKKHKKEKKAMKKAQKALQYAAPIAGIGFMGYALHKGLKHGKHHHQGHHGHHYGKSSSSSSSSSSSDSD